MIKFNLQLEMAGLVRKARVAKEQIPFAVALALTKTAQAIKEAEVTAMGSAFKQTTSYTRNSMAVKAAQKTMLQATIGTRDPGDGGAAKWLAPEIFGGARHRALELLLAKANLPPSGMYAVPGSAAKMKGGHIDINWVASLVTDMIAQGVTGKVTKAHSRRKHNAGLTYFVLPARRGKLLPGIYGKRVTTAGKTKKDGTLTKSQAIATAGALYPFIIFVAQPKYAKRYDFHGIAQRTAVARFPQAFAAAVRKAMASAR